MLKSTIGYTCGLLAGGSHRLVRLEMSRRKNTPKHGLSRKHRGVMRMEKKSVCARNDRFTTSRPELTLIRVGHYLWAQHKTPCGRLPRYRRCASHSSMSVTIGSSSAGP